MIFSQQRFAAPSIAIRKTAALEAVPSSRKVHPFCPRSVSAACAEAFAEVYLAFCLAGQSHHPDPASCNSAPPASIDLDLTFANRKTTTSMKEETNDTTHLSVACTCDSDCIPPHSPTIQNQLRVRPGHEHRHRNRYGHRLERCPRDRFCHHTHRHYDQSEAHDCHQQRWPV